MKIWRLYAFSKIPYIEKYGHKYLVAMVAKAKNTGAWKGRLKRFFVNPYPEELAKNGANVI